MSEIQTKAAGDASGRSAKKPTKAVVTAQQAPPNLDDMEAEIEATRQRLKRTLDDLQVAANPRNVADRQVKRVQGFYTDEYGAVRGDRVAKTVGAVVAVIVVWRVVKRIAD